MPFVKADSLGPKYIKLFVYGKGGSGKTHMSLSFPNPFVVDNEMGTITYESRPPFKGNFHVLRTRSFSETIRELEDLLKRPEIIGGTIVIDSMTRIYNNLKGSSQQTAEARTAKLKKPIDDSAVGKREWGIIRMRFDRILSHLSNAPCHVVITSWLKDRYENDKVVGTTYDCDRALEYWPDLLVKLEVDESKKRWAIIEKDRTGRNLTNVRIENPTPSNFLALLNPGAVHTIMETVDEALEKDASEFALPHEGLTPKPVVTTPSISSPKITPVTPVPKPPNTFQINPYGARTGKIYWNPAELSLIKLYSSQLDLKKPDLKRIFENDCSSDKTRFVECLKRKMMAAQRMAA